jgi:NAD(P)-dependent dehydrogenase (short-subunit alcohol dehydrogenase family)
MNLIGKDQKRVVIVTGAGRGIGQFIAKAFLQKGDDVILAELNEELGRETERMFVKQGYRAHFFKTDVSKVDNIQHLMTYVSKKFERVDVLINNAGISEFSDVLELDEMDWDRILATNLKGVFFCAKEVAKLMKANGGGSIVNISSTRALMSEPNSEAYAASKGGILALTHALAASLSKYAITVNAVLPGWIETGDYSKLKNTDHTQHHSGRVGLPDDIAQACIFLTDKQNNFITGTQLVIDGGMTRKMIYEE